ncbi:ABC transporter substrate-binding protein [Bradyrhizobium sp.]|uniref:ABC transporter substrate-binding protein n=1 Tax=Bradyrhizobium sp. TaxID=376 RepID=UPI002D49D32C|nr:ABC transporter substrate-binding protein [Bradyrhizobium sp.]HZR72630.1 ABC transporter substrate-binding protein [Bradyrhizobium sp.]
MALAGGAATAAWPRTLGAQQSAMPVIGFLHSGLKMQSAQAVDGFKRGLAETGFVEGRNLEIQYRFAEGQYDRLPTLAGELISRRVAVIAACGGIQTALSAKSASATIPLVFGNGSDPVQFGLVKSLNRPAGNMTGVSYITATLEAKRLGLLSELLPSAGIFGILVNPRNDNADNQLKDIAQGALALSRPITILKASNEQEIEAAFQAFAQQGISALLVGSDPYFASQREHIVSLAARYKMPAISEWREFAQAGGLASYGTNLTDNYRLVGVYVGRILKGEKPAELPVVQATKFEFVINLKTAKSLGLTLPPGPLSTVDDVIE